MLSSVKEQYKAPLYHSRIKAELLEAPNPIPTGILTPHSDALAGHTAVVSVQDGHGAASAASSQLEAGVPSATATALPVDTVAGLPSVASASPLGNVEYSWTKIVSPPFSAVFWGMVCYVVGEFVLRIGRSAAMRDKTLEIPDARQDQCCTFIGEGTVFC